MSQNASVHFRPYVKLLNLNELFVLCRNMCSIFIMVYDRSLIYNLQLFVHNDFIYKIVAIHLVTNIGYVL